MNPEENNWQEIEYRLEELLHQSKIESLEYESLEFNYNHYWNAVYLGMEFDTKEPCVSLADLERIKRLFTKNGFKVSTINIYPLNYNGLSFRICFEF